MDSRIILIAFLLLLLCFESFTVLSANKPETITPTGNNIQVNASYFPVLTPKSVNGVYVLIMKNHHSIFFVSNKVKNVNEENYIKYSGKLIDFNGIISTNLKVPKSSSTGIASSIGNLLKKSKEVSNGYVGNSVGFIEYFTGSGAAKKLALGAVFFVRTDLSMYIYSGVMDILWTIIGVFFLLSFLSLAKGLSAAGQVVTEISAEQITNTLRSVSQEIENLFSRDTIDAIAYRLKSIIGKGGVESAMENPVGEATEVTMVGDAFGELSENYVDILNKQVESLGVKEIAIKISVDDIDTDTLKTYANEIFNNKLNDEQVNELIKYLREHGIENIENKDELIENIDSIIKELNEKGDTEEFLNEIKNFLKKDEGENIEILKPVSELTKEDWEKYSDTIVNSIFKKYSEQILEELNINDNEAKTIFSSTIKDTMSKYTEELENAIKQKNIEDFLDKLVTKNGLSEFDETFIKNLANKISENENLNNLFLKETSNVDLESIKNILEKNNLKLSEESEGNLLDYLTEWHKGKITTDELFNNIKTIKTIGSKEEILNEIKDTLENRPRTLEDLLKEILNGKCEGVCGDYYKQLTVPELEKSQTFKEIFENIGKIDGKSKATFFVYLTNIYINPVLGIKNIDVNLASDIVTALENKLNDENFEKLLEDYGYSKEDINSLESYIKDLKNDLKNTQTAEKIVNNVNQKLSIKDTVFNLIKALFYKPIGVAKRFLTDLWGAYIKYFEFGTNGIAKIIEKMGWNSKWRFLISALILMGITNAIKDAMYNWYYTSRIKTGYTHGYLVILDSSNPNEKLELMADTRFYSRFTDELLRKIPYLGSFFGRIFTICKDPSLFSRQNIASFVDEFLINIPGFEHPAQVLLSVVPDRYTLILGKGELKFDYMAKKVVIVESKNNLIISRGAPTLNDTLVKLYKSIEISYLYISPVKIYGTNDYEITKKGYDALVQSIEKLGNTNDASLILGLNPAQAVYVSGIYKNTNYFSSLPVTGILGAIGGTIGISAMAQLLCKAGLFTGVFLGALEIGTALLRFTPWYWVIEDVGIGSKYKIAISEKEKISNTCINIVYPLLSALNSKSSDSEVFKRAVSWCTGTTNDISNIFNKLGFRMMSYFPITLDWYQHGPSNNIYIPGTMYGELEITKKYSSGVDLACALSK